MATAPDQFRAALDREEAIDRLAEQIAAKINGADTEMAMAALARAMKLITTTPRQPTPKLPPPSKLRAPKAYALADAGFTDRIIGALEATPRMPLADLAQVVYGGSDRTSQGKVRSLLAALKKAGRATNVAPGQWEVLPA